MKYIVFAIPLLVYFVSEYFWGTWVAIGLSGLLPIAQIIQSLIKKQCIHQAAVFDIILIAVFALVECLPFKMGVTFAIIGLMMLLSATGVVDLMKYAAGGMFDSVSGNPYAIQKMRFAQGRMAIWCIAGSVLSIVPATCFDGSNAQAWIDEWLLVCIGLGYIATELIVGRINYYQYHKVEWVPLMNEDAKVVGACPRPLVHDGSHWLHPVVHLHVFSHGKILLQLRPLSKKIQPGKWDTAVGGHIGAGEKLEDALKREVWEEIGLGEFNAQLIKQYIWKCPAENEYVFSFKTESGGPFSTKNVGEVDELRFWTKDELQNSIGKEVFTPNLEHELVEWILPNM